MNQLRKNAALKVFSELPAETSKEEKKKIILADAKGYTEDEADEIIEALETYKPDEEPAAKGQKKSSTNNVTFEEWRVKPTYKDILDNADRVIGRKLLGFEKDAKDPIRKTSITRERAELLNSQSENTLTRLYEVS